MAYTNICAFFYVMIAFFEASMAALYEVGDASGWTNKGIDYKSWASSHKFQLGDIIIFNYNPQIHNVLQVTKEDYHACSSTTPLAIYTSGNDPVEFHSPGKYYFICSFPGMCQDGQKVEIKVSSRINPTPTTPVRPPFTNPTPPGSTGTNPHYWYYSASSAVSLSTITLGSCLLLHVFRLLCLH